MAHHLAQDSAIFSPSVARIAASNARDWSYVDSWLAVKFHGGSVPPFERNPETLKALLALASLNETADEDRLAVAKADATALGELRPKVDANQRQSLTDGLLDALQDELSVEGHTALDALAQIALQQHVAFPEPQLLGRQIVHLKTSASQVEQSRARVEALSRHIQHEASATDDFLRRLEGDDFKPPSQLARQNLELQRKLKAMAARLPDALDAPAPHSTPAGSSHPAVADILSLEQEYLAVLARKRELDLQLASFLGLPSDPDTARSELGLLRKRLRSATTQRDAVFEGLVERESPVKRR